jgi:hypothetical protein
VWLQDRVQVSCSACAVAQPVSHSLRRGGGGPVPLPLMAGARPRCYGAAATLCGGTLDWGPPNGALGATTLGVGFASLGLETMSNAANHNTDREHPVCRWWGPTRALLQDVTGFRVWGLPAAATGSSAAPAGDQWGQPPGSGMQLCNGQREHRPRWSHG